MSCFEVDVCGQDGYSKSMEARALRRRYGRARTPLTVHFKPGDRLAIHPHKSAPGRGLSYRAMTVVARDEGRGGQHGGWDVYDGVTSDGREVSFYGFSVVRRVGR